MNNYKYSIHIQTNLISENFLTFNNQLKKTCSFLKVMIFVLAVLGSLCFVQNSFTNQQSETSDKPLSSLINPSTIELGQLNNQPSTTVVNPSSRFSGFIQNTGQIKDLKVKLYASFSDYNVYFAPHQIIFMRTSGNSVFNNEKVIINLVGSRGISPSGFKLISSSNQNNAFQEVWYYNIYPKIDLRYYVTTTGLKYDFIVKPGGDPSNILVQVLNSGNLVINDKSINLYSSLASNYLLYSDSGLHSYQADRTSVSTSFMKVDGLSNAYQFAIGNYNPEQVLFIDPYVAFNPISITSNGAFYNFSLAYGWAGTGTASSPYIIDNINITSNAANTPAIYIANTNVYFIIQNSYFETNGTNSYSVYLNNVTNGELNNNTFAGFKGSTGALGYSPEGLHIWNSPNINITNNLFEYRLYGVSIYGTGYNNYLIFNNTFNHNNYAFSSQAINMTIDSNTFYNDTFAIDINSNSPQTNIISNNILNASADNYGIWVAGNNTIVTGNKIYNYNTGINIQGGLPGAHNITVINNIVNASNTYGISIQQSSYNILVTNNNVTNSYTSIFIYQSYNLSIQNNHFLYTGYRGVYLLGTVSNLLIEGNQISTIAGNTNYCLISQTAILTNILFTNNNLQVLSTIGYGIFIQGDNGSVISSNTITGGQTGIYFLLSNGTKITGNTFTGTSYAIDLSSSNNTIISYNQMTTGAYGIQFSNSFYNIIQYNNITHFATGMYILLHSTYNLVSFNNITQNNVGNGIWINAANNNTFTHNLVYYANQGIYLSQVNYTVITNNYITGCIYYGVQIINGPTLSHNNVIKFNDLVNNYPSNPQAYDNGTNDVFLFNYYSDHTNIDTNGDQLADSPYLLAGFSSNSDPMPSVSTIYNTEKLLGMQVLYPNGGNVFGTIQISWSFAEDSFGINNATYNVYYSSDNGANWYSLALTITNNVLIWDTTTVIPGNYLIKVTVSNGLVTNQDLSNSQFSLSTQPTVILISSNADFATYASSGDGSQNNPYIIENYMFSKSNHTVVMIENTDSYFILRYNTITGDSSAGIYGIYLLNVKHGTIFNNTIAGFDSGILINSSSYIVVDSNIVFGNNNAGIYLTSSNYVTVELNTVYGNGNYGIFLENSSNNVLNQNEIYLTGTISLVQFTTLSVSKITSTIGGGIILDPSVNNTISKNIVYNNGGTGITLDLTNNSLVTYNSIYNNQINGLENLNSNSNTYSNNFIFDNGNSNLKLAKQLASFSYQYSRNQNTNNFVSIDKITSTIGGGIILDPSNGTKIIDNVIYNNGLNGIVVQASSNSQIIGNVIYDHSSYGLTLDSLTTNSYIYHNEFFINNLGGTSQASDDGSNNVFTNNYWSDLNGRSVYPIDGLANNSDTNPLVFPIKYPVYVLYPANILTPKNDATVSNQVDLKWSTGHDTFNHTILYSLSYKSSSDNNWISIASSLNVTSYSWNIGSISDGKYLIKLDSYYKSIINSTIISISIQQGATSSVISSTRSTSTFNLGGFEFIYLLLVFPIAIFIVKRKNHKK